MKVRNDDPSILPISTFILLLVMIVTGLILLFA